jgi:Flp pilus assembly protein TadG
MIRHTSRTKDEVTLLDQPKNKRSERGQVFALVAILVPLLIVFVGFAIDLGLAYVTKTTLSKSVDAAALSAMRNLNQGKTSAATAALNAFNVNYQSVPGLGAPPTPSVVWGTDSNGNTLVNISATATIPTYFLRALAILPGVGSSFNTTSITISAQAVRNPLVMSLILDKSGSMNLNGGATVLPGDVNTFINYFDEGIDNISEISFSSVDSVDVPMTTNFVTPINNEMGKIAFGGATFAQAGLQDGYNQILSAPATPNIIRVAVFFTDGWANTNGLPTNVTTATASTTHDVLNCTGTAKTPSNTPMNYGGCSPVEAAVGWCSGFFFMNPSTGSTTTCPNATTFPALDGGGNALSPVSTAQTNVANDATYRTEQVAANMRINDNITIYSIGLGNKINQAYLQDIANDPAAATYDSSQPQGEAVFAPDPTQLNKVFETIASKILLRLSQ